MQAFYKAHPLPKRDEGSHERPGDLARPSLYVTSASLVHQTAKEISLMSSKLKVTLIGGDPATSAGVYDTQPGLPGPEDSVWDTTRGDNIRNVHVISYNLLAKHYGPQAYWDAVKADLSNYLEEKGIWEAGFDWHRHVSDGENLPENPDPKYVRDLSKSYAYAFGDEAQECLRNPSSFWRVFSWINPIALVLMTGYPAPRGMEDFASYVRLLERTELRAEHDRLRELVMDIKKGFADPAMMPKYIPGKTDPFLLPDDDPKYVPPMGLAIKL
jgi:hypothetical protein